MQQVDVSASQGELIRQRFDLFEEFSQAVHGWDLDFCQLGSSKAPYYLQQLAGESVLISRAYFSPGFYQLGGATLGCRTVSILVPRQGGSQWRWCGESVTPNSLVVMPRGGEFESISAPDFDSIHLAIAIPALEQVAQREFQLPLHRVMPDGRCFCADGGEPLRTLRALLQGLTLGPDNAYGQPALVLDQALEQELAYLVLACIAGSDASLPRGPRTKRMQSLARAMEVLSEDREQVMDMAQLVAAVGISRRTLENAFKDGFGVGPATFLKSRRLHQLHRSLLQAEGASHSVAAMARQHGFQHQGQMAADYRQLFGELPSVTLKRPA